MTPSSLALLPRFLSHLVTERRLSPHTVASYRIDLEFFVAYCELQGISEWAQLDGPRVRAYAAAEHRRNLAPRSIQRRLSALRSFFNYLLREGELQRNPALGIQAPKSAKRLPKVLDADQMAKLLAFRTDDSLSVRDKAIMELFYSSGLRLAELAALNVSSDLDLKDQLVRVVGKGRKTRVVPVGRYAVAALTAWLQERTTIAKPGEQALFVGRNGERLGMRAIQLRVAQWARAQGLPMHVHPHVFRHSFASHLLESSQDLRGVQELLGHANLTTTQVYTHLDFQHLAKIYDATHPRARRKS
jgi:integrase/recombinase XerC